MPSNDEPADAGPAQASTLGQVAVTVDLANGRIVRVEGVDDAGERHDLTDEERAGLAHTAANGTVRRLVEQAFEAGIGCALGEEEDDEDEPEESAEEAELSGALLRSLLDESAAGKLMEPEALRRAIVGTLIEQAVAPTGASTH